MKSLFTDFHLDRILLVVVIVVGAHVAVIGVKAVGTKLLSAMPRASFNKVRSLAGLATSFIIFGLYFTALGLVLKEFGISLKQFNLNYSDWMVSVNYEVEKKEIPLSFRDFPRKKED
jgi:phosphate starvation-inducible membrane PsiE